MASAAPADSVEPSPDPDLCVPAAAVDPLRASSATSSSAAATHPSPAAAALKRASPPRTLQCVVCFDAASPPVRLPCKCASLLCFACFESFMAGHSKCLICREPIVSKLRRACAGKGLEAMIDQALLAEMQSGARPAAALPDTRAPLIPPEPGELARQAHELVQKHRSEREQEELESLRLIELLKSQGDEDVVKSARDPAAEDLASARLVEALKRQDQHAVAPAGPSAKKGKWACRHCTFETDVIWLRCGACGRSKFGAG
jgi:hypothetical protein